VNIGFPIRIQKNSVGSTILLQNGPVKGGHEISPKFRIHLNGESKVYFYVIKGTVLRDFSNLGFFHQKNRPWAPD
jgi:hypothetical protein